MRVIYDGENQEYAGQEVLFFADMDMLQGPMILKGLQVEHTKTKPIFTVMIKGTRELIEIELKDVRFLLL